MRNLRFVTTIATLALFFLALVLGARLAMRQLAAPFEGLEQIAGAQRVPVQAAEPDNEETIRKFEWDAPMAAAPTAESSIEEVRESTPDSIASLQAVKRELDALVAPQTRVTCVQFRFFRRSTLSESQRTMVAEWDVWRAQAIAGLPESIRYESDYRTAIEETYASACGAIFESVHIPEVQEGRGIITLDGQPVVFIDIDDRADAEPANVIIPLGTTKSD